MKNIKTIRYFVNTAANRQKVLWMSCKVLIVCFFLITSSLSSQTLKDSVTINQIQDELRVIKQLREKDSLKMALLTKELTMLLKDLPVADSIDDKVDSLFLRQKAEVERLRQNIEGVPVVFYGDTLFSIYSSLGPYDARTRVEKLQESLVLLYEMPFFFPDSITVRDSNGFLNITYQKDILSGITITDALWANTTPEELAEIQANAIKDSIVKHRQQNSWKNNMLRIVELLIIIGLAALIVWVINRFFRLIKNIFLTDKNRFLNGIKIRNYELIKKERIIAFISRALSVIKIILLLVLFATVIPLVFSVFPSTQNWSEVIREWISDPIKRIWISFLNYLPKLITIVIILIIVRYVLRMMRFFALEIERGALTIKGFYPEWAKPTYSLARFVLLMFTLVVVFPYLPGSDSMAFKGVSVFLGVLISIGSSSAVANAVAGLVITYMRPFQPGDWIKTGDTIGIVIEKNALVTRLRTINNEDVSVPNSSVLSGATINYSSLGRTTGLVITAKIKVRYQYSHNLIEELLLQAAQRTKDISEKPYPYVFQLSLGEINVEYELNAFTFAPENMYFIKSDLIKNIQNEFRQAKVEIQSVQYVEIRGTENSKQ